MTRLVEAGRWVFFDVLAASAANGAHVAMALRERLPAATIRSEPDRSESKDPLYPHLLHCRACVAAQDAEHTQEAIAAALRDLAALAGEQPRARVLFRESAPARTSRAA
jgi:hypothetical protein